MRCKEIDYSKRKLRGNRRYYRNLKRWASTFSLQLSGDNWYDLWHTHLDWYGRGNSSTKARQQHLMAMFLAFGNILQQAKASGISFQAFVNICIEDAIQDALYFHTPNPNANNFPYQFDGYEWQVDLPKFLEPFVDNRLHEIGKIRFDARTWYTIVPLGEGGRR